MINPIEAVEDALLKELASVPDDFKPDGERALELIKIGKSTVGDLQSGTELYVLARAFQDTADKYLEAVTNMSDEEKDKIVQEFVQQGQHEND